MPNEISGKLVCSMVDKDNKDYATIIPDPVDVSKIREGDEVWVKVAFTSRHDFPEIVAHFPKQESKPDLPHEFCMDSEMIKHYSMFEVNTMYIFNKIIRYLRHLEEK